MKLRSLLEIEYGVHDLLTRNRTQIEFVHGHQKYRDLQLMLSQKRDKEVEEWLRANHHRHHAEVGGADNNNLGAIPFYEVDADHEDEEYCPVCADKLKETIKKLVAECWKTHKQVGMKKKGDRTVPNCVPKNEEIDGLENAEINLAERPYKILDIEYKKTYRGDKFVKITYEQEYVPGKMYNSEGQFVSVFYDTDEDLEVIKKRLDFPIEIDEAKKGKCKPSKGKRFAKRVDGKCRSFGQKGKAKKGGDRIRPGTKKGHAYCARSAKIKKCKNPPCANALSRKKWKCQGSRSVK